MIRVLSGLFRPRLSILNAVTAMGGFQLFSPEPEWTLLIACCCGVALLAAGGSAINQVLEWELDGRMERTRRRPVPVGQVTPREAASIGAIAIMAGLTGLVLFGGLIPAICGAAALVWYLAVYTPLKRHTSGALLLGAMCGAVPPVIGWCMAGGSPSDYRILLLAGMLFLWQIPHFWMLQRRHADDYRAAGIPLFGGAEKGIGYIGIWLMALTASALLLPIFAIPITQNHEWYILLPVPMLIAALLRREKALFVCLNLFPLLLTLVLLLH